MKALPPELDAYFAQYLGSDDTADPKVRKRRRILSMATDLFVRQGYRKTSMDEVARAAGVAKGTVYTYFAAKVDLLIAALFVEKREALVAMPDVFDSNRPARDRLRDFVVFTLLVPLRMPLSSALMRGDEDLTAVMSELPPALLSEGNELRDRMLAPLLEEVAGNHRWTPSELHDRIQVLSGLSFFSVHLPTLAQHGEISVERYAEVMAELIVGGLQGPPQGSKQ